MRSFLLSAATFFSTRVCARIARHVGNSSALRAINGLQCPIQRLAATSLVLQSRFPNAESFRPFFVTSLYCLDAIYLAEWAAGQAFLV